MSLRRRLMVVLAGLGLCGGCEARDALVEGGEVGASCGPAKTAVPRGAEVCAEGLVCRDGLCRERGSVVAAEPDLPPVVSFDVLAPPDVDAAGDAADAAGDAEGDSSDDADAPGDVAAEITLLGAHDAATAPSEVRLSLGENQAAVRQFVVPEGGPRRPAGIEVYVTRIVDAPACARFRIVIWLPDANGMFAIPASWQSLGEALLTEAAGPQFVAAGEGAPELTPGPVRAGLAYLGPCPGTSLSPWVALDVSGDTSDSFVWAGNWIPGQSLGLDGRWALRLAVGDGLP